MLNNTDLVHELNVVETEAPFYVNVWTVDATVIFRDKNGSMSTGFEFVFHNKEETIDFVNTWNLQVKDKRLELTTDEMNTFFLKLKAKASETSLSGLKENLVNFSTRENVSIDLRAAKPIAYYNEFGRKQSVLINQTFCPYSTLAIKHKQFNFEYDGNTIRHFVLSDFILPNDDPDVSYKQSQLLKEYELFYYYSLEANKIPRTGVTICDESLDYTDNVVEIKVNKKTLKVSCDLYPNFLKNTTVYNYS